MQAGSYQRKKLRELAERVEFARPRDEMGQFADTSDTTPEKMRQAYVKPLRKRLRLLRPRRFEASDKALIEFGQGHEEKKRGILLPTLAAGGLLFAGAKLPGIGRKMRARRFKKALERAAGY